MEHSERDDDDDDDKNGTEKLVEKEYLFLIAVGCCSLFCNSILSFFSQCITVLSWLQCGCGFKLEQEREKARWD